MKTDCANLVNIDELIELVEPVCTWWSIFFSYKLLHSDVFKESSLKDSI